MYKIVCLTTQLVANFIYVCIIYIESCRNYMNDSIHIPMLDLTSQWAISINCVHTEYSYCASI